VGANIEKMIIGKDIWRAAMYERIVAEEDEKLSSEKSLMMFVDAHSELIIRRMMICHF